jgi:flagellar hook-length control protein FliK
MVMATIRKAIDDGGNTQIKLELDPPELGRVEVKMSMNKDNAAKVVLTIEKPETYLMLQRDMHILERVLQESGLNADGGLSFELAQDDSAFNQSNGRHSGHGSGGTGASGTEDAHTIETTLNWIVDPATGLRHYNVLV